MKSLGDYTLNYEENYAWMDLLKLPVGSTARDLAAAQMGAGDATMTALWRHVQVNLYIFFFLVKIIVCRFFLQSIRFPFH